VLVCGHWAGLNMLGDEPEVNFDLVILGFQGEKLFYFDDRLDLVSPRQTSIYVMCPWDHDI
jgi:hypothetical protein